jgi:hypothetical protein
VVFGPEVRCAVDLPGDAAVGKNTFWAVGRDRLAHAKKKLMHWVWFEWELASD